MVRVVTMPPETSFLDDGARVGGWWHTQDESGRVICDLCPRACSLKPGDRGFCFVRENRDGQMVLSTYGRSTGFCIDPIEKKPLNHFYPGTSVLSFGTAGCNLGCKFCQNWSISKSREVQRLSEQATPEAIAEAARQLDCRSVAFTYNDPVIWAEYAIDAARACHAVNIKTVAVTAGYITTVARGPFFETMDAANVDLKGFTEDFYQHLTLSHLEPVLETLQWLKNETDVWFEITNLVIPRANDSDDEFREMCDWVLSHLGDEVPVHFTAFHPDFRLRDREPTPRETLLRAYDVARRTGLRHVYVGNVNDVHHQSTYCANCQKVVIERDWYELGAYHLIGNRCGHCGAKLAGHFESSPGKWGRKRMPVQISSFVPRQSIVDVPAKGTNPMSTLPPETAANLTQAPELTDEQKDAIRLAACEIVSAAVIGDRAVLTDATLGGAAEKTVWGCFVTIKRKGRLRGCCGTIGRASTILRSLTDAATTTATRDARLPPISPSELPYLDLSVSLLHGIHPVTVNAEDREQAVTVGRHGLQISLGDSRGLLLPSVATENGLDALHFFQQVCLKAGLPPTAWKDEDARLATFECLSMGGPFHPSALAKGPRDFLPKFPPEQLARLAAVCRGNVLALMRGATPTYYAPDCPDGTVQCITVWLVLPQNEDVRRYSQLSIRPGLPLQATTMELAKAAAASLSAGGFHAEELAECTIDLSVLYDPAMHGTVSAPDLAGLDPHRRAVLVMENDKSAIRFDPGHAAEELAESAAREAQIQTPETASIISLEAASTKIPFTIANVPKPRRGTSVRPPAVAGTFYPSDAGELDRLVDELLLDIESPKRAWSAAMVPHAGLIYSGRLAAAVLRQIDFPDTVIIIGPKHTRFGVDWSVAPHESWSLPGRTVASDPVFAGQLADSIPNLQLDDVAHAKEHAIEVELPFLARLAPRSRVVGIAIGTGDLWRCRQFADGLAQLLHRRRERTLLVISTDMNHFATDAETRRLDEMALTALDRCDAEALYEVVRREHISMCGVLPAVIVLETLKKLGRLEESVRVGYATSADVTGDRSRVVGYAGMLFA